MFYRFLVVFLMLPFLSSAQFGKSKFVDPFIGTGGHGHTFPGATMPHGMVQLSPDTRLTGWDGCSGYHYSDNFIFGFSHTHLSGTGVSDYGDILLMPVLGKPSPINKEYGSPFSHDDEEAHPGYYRVKLQKPDVMADFTVTERVGIHRYKFSRTTDAHIILDLEHRDEVLESYVEVEDSFTVSGLRRSRAWAENQYVYFVMKFDKPIVKSGSWEGDKVVEYKRGVQKRLKNWFRFDMPSGSTLMAKVAISSVSIDGARKNMEIEMPGWNFEGIKNAAAKKWDEELLKIDIKTKSNQDQVKFYTALYHTAIAPNINMDVDGHYRGRDNKIHHAEGFTNYTVFSLWDTYRAAHPLYSIIDKKRTLDYLKSFLAQFEQANRLPVWELASNETDCMIGYHSVPVILDAYVNSVQEFDVEAMWKAIETSANYRGFGLQDYIKNGLINVEDEHESVSKTLEYAFDDWCAAQFARHIGKNDKYEEFLKRSQYYKNVLDIKTGFMRPRKNGDWISPFDPREVNNNFTEANSWQYSFYFPQDVSGWMNLMKGDKSTLEKKLDKFFADTSGTTGRDQADITGLIGQYAHGNEPSHHIAYLYNFTNKPYRTQELTTKILREMYSVKPDGLIGNEDCGQMSAWYVLSALGFYPVAPGSGIYELTAPIVNGAIITPDVGSPFQIRVQGNGNYIDSMAIGTKEETLPPSQSFITNEMIMNGTPLTFYLSTNPNNSFGKSRAVPGIKFETSKQELVVNPVINGGPISFRGSKAITITSSQPGVNIFYTLDGSEPSNKSKKYLSPLTINANTTVKAIAYNKFNDKSFVTTAKYVKVANNWKVTYTVPYNPQYTAGGNDGLIDGIRGDVNWRKGNWQGFQGADMEVVIDLGALKSVSSVEAGFLQDSRAWIVAPVNVSVEISTDGKIFKNVATQPSKIEIKDLNVQLVPVTVSFDKQSTRYLRIRAKQYGLLPSWHEGAGGKTHIFVDEIMVK